MAATNDQKTLRDRLQLVFRRRWLFVISACLFAAGAIIVAHFMPLQYTGTAKFRRRVDPASEGMADTKVEGFAAKKLTLAEELTGRAAVIQAVEQIPQLVQGIPVGRDGRYTDDGQRMLQDIVDRVMSRVEVRWPVRSDVVDVIAVSYTDGDPVLARKIPNVLMENYIAKVTKESADRLKESLQHIGEKMQDANQLVQEALRKKTLFQAAHPDAMPESPGMLRERIENLSAEISALRESLRIDRMELAQLEELSQQRAVESNEPISVVRMPNPKLDELKGQLANLQQLRQRERQIKKETHDDIKEIDRQIVWIEDQIKQTPPTVIKESVYGRTDNSIDLRMARARLTASIKGTANQLERNEQRLARSEKVMENFVPIRQEYEQLLRTLGDHQKKFSDYRDQYMSLQVTLSAELAKRRTRHEIIQYAQKQYTPSSPTLAMVLGMAVIGGLGCGAGLAFLVNAVDHSVNLTQDAAKRFDIPVVGVIGMIESGPQRMIKRLRTWILGPVVAVVLIGIIGVAGLSITLKLHYPEKHQQWKSDPVHFIVTHTAEPIRDLTR